ncbi:MAG: JAB domain-containing protein [Armatimonadota bacterium]
MGRERFTQQKLFNVPGAKPRTRSFSWVGVKLVREGRAGYTREISRPQDVYEVVRPLLEDRDREAVVVLLLDAKNRVNAAHVVAVGLLDSCPVHPREVFKAAVLANAASVIVAHNHPSGDATPSQEDRQLALRLRQAGDILGIPLLDFLVVGDGQYASLSPDENWVVAAPTS